MDRGRHVTGNRDGLVPRSYFVVWVRDSIASAESAPLLFCDPRGVEVRMSSGEDCDLQIDVGKVEENPKKKEKKQQRGSVSREEGGGGGGQGDVWKPGDLVWAKVSGFNHWPGKVSRQGSP